MREHQLAVRIGPPLAIHLSDDHLSAVVTELLGSPMGHAAFFAYLHESSILSKAFFNDAPMWLRDHPERV